MTRQPLFFALIVPLTFGLTACQQDLGPYKEVTRTCFLANFDRLDMASAFHVDVRQDNAFKIEIRGNEVDVNDLDLSVRNSMLHIEYRNSVRKQRYDTYITITMPTLRAVNFSGAVKLTIAGFTNLTALDVDLSGASKVDVSLNAAQLTSHLLGASNLTIVGSGNSLTSELSGASKLAAYDFPLGQANLDLSGASSARVRVQDVLTIKASDIRYRGTPHINSNVSGASTIAQD